jgi:hypothetical protein
MSNKLKTRILDTLTRAIPYLPPPAVELVTEFLAGVQLDPLRVRGVTQDIERLPVSARRALWLWIALSLTADNWAYSLFTIEYYLDVIENDTQRP